MTMQAVEMTEAPARIAERVSRLEGSSEQVSERLRDLTTQMEALRAELRLELATGLTAQAAATESLRAEMNRKFEAQAAQMEALRVELKAQAAQLAQLTAQMEALRVELKAQREETRALGESIRAEMNARFAEVSGRLNVLTAAFIGAAVAQFAATIGLAATILPRL